MSTGISSALFILYKNWKSKRGTKIISKVNEKIVNVLRIALINDLLFESFTSLLIQTLNTIQDPGSMNAATRFSLIIGSLMLLLDAKELSDSWDNQDI